MHYQISGEYLDGDNFAGEWLDTEAAIFVVNNANESEVLSAIADQVKSGRGVKNKVNK